MRRVVVTGLGMVTPLAASVEETWSRLLAGNSGAGPITHFDAEGFGTGYACEVKRGDGTNGTTNPWGLDYDDHGQWFFTNNVINHLWHVVPGAHYKRMFGDDFNPHLYQLIEKTADHYHWDAAGRDLMTPMISGVMEIRDGRISALRDYYNTECYEQEPSEPDPAHIQA